MQDRKGKEPHIWQLLQRIRISPIIEEILGLSYTKKRLFRITSRLGQLPHDIEGLFLESLKRMSGQTL